MVRFVALALMALMVAVPSAGAAPIIDDFTTTTFLGPTVIVIPPPVLVPGLQVSNMFPGPTTVVDNPATNTTGGVRTATLGPYSGPANLTDSVSITIDSGVLNFNSTTGASATLVLLYDANSAGLNEDFTGYQSLTLSVLNFDFAFGNPLPITLTLTDTGSNSFSSTINVNSGGAQPIDFPLAAFQSGGVNLSSIQSVELTFTGNTAHNFTIDAIQLTAIPEPATLALWGVVGAAGAWYGRRRLSKKAPANA
jgi:hypothetical protein